MRAERDFEVYRHDDQRIELCVVGFSWPAFLLSWVWALWNRLWLPAVGLFVFEIIAVISSSLVKLGMLPVSLGSGTAVRLYAAFKAREWRVNSLEARGFRFCGYVSAFTYFRAKQLASRGEIRRYKTTDSANDWFSIQPGWLQGMLAVTKLTWKAAF